MTDLARRVADQAAAIPEEELTPEQVEARRMHAVKEHLEQMTPDIAKALPAHLTAERMARIAFTQVRKSPKLALCSPESLAGAVLTSAQLGLEPGPTQEVYYIPRWNSKLDSMEATFYLGYQGMVTLFWRHPLAAYLATATVYEHDEFSWRLGLEPQLHHVPRRSAQATGEEPDRGVRAGYWYAVARLTNGGYAMQVLDRHDVEARRARSSQSDSPAWRNDYDAMAEKSCIRAMFNLLPRSAEIQRAISWDGAVRTDLGAIDEASPEPAEPEEATEVDADDTGSEPER